MRTTKFPLARAIPVAGLLVALSGADILAATTVAIYPGSHVDAAYMRFSDSAASMKSQQIMGTISTAYASSDSYAKIYSFYKRRYKPDQQLLDSVTKEKPDPRDPVVPRAMFYIDGSILTLGVFQGRNLIFISQHK